jgi:predicted ABC-type ATPase
LIYLSLPSADDAIARVAMRVRQGGHGTRQTWCFAGSPAACEIF